MGKFCESTYEEALVVKNSRNKLLHAVDVAQFNAQYANSLIVRVSDKFHDRFLVIDKTTLIHVGASLNCLGKKTSRTSPTSWRRFDYPTQAKRFLLYYPQRTERSL